jgi:hypothetical protein
VLEEASDHPVFVVLAQPATRSALIVGVSNYASPEITPLEGIPSDIISARSIARAMGIPDSRITVLRDGQATKAAILAAMEYLAASVTPGSLVFVYFSGHGTRWYEPALKGGLAAQGVRDCLLSKATDRNGSGAVSVDEIQQCAQKIVAHKLKPFPDLKSHHITVCGNRNIVPVAVVRPQPPSGRGDRLS